MLGVMVAEVEQDGLAVALELTMETHGTVAAVEQGLHLLEDLVFHTMLLD
jgi:hypothetical protein